MLTILPEPPLWKAVLGFDFDDTLVLKSAPTSIDPLFFDCIEWIRSTYGAAWGIATGRSLHQLLEGFHAVKFPVLPDFVIARERELYYPGQFGRWVPDEEWNRACEKDHKKLFRRSRRAFARLQKFIEAETDAEWVSIEGDAAAIVATTDEEMDRIIDLIEISSCPSELTYERNSIYLRFSHRKYNKGSGLLQAADRWGLGADKILAVGDNYNDLSMLQPEVCEACGCPSNAVEAVKQHVQLRGGQLAKSPGSRGVMEIMRFFFDQ